MPLGAPGRFGGMIQNRSRRLLAVFGRAAYPNIRANNFTPMDKGLFEIEATLEPKNLEESITAVQENITDAVANGFIQACNLTIGEFLPQMDDVLRVYPNPASTQVTIEINVTNESQVQLRLVDMVGKEISFKDYGMVSAASSVNINTSALGAGLYIVELAVNGRKITKRLVIE